MMMKLTQMCNFSNIEMCRCWLFSNEIVSRFYPFYFLSRPIPPARPFFVRHDSDEDFDSQMMMMISPWAWYPNMSFLCNTVLAVVRCKYVFDFHSMGANANLIVREQIWNWFRFVRSAL